MAIHTTEEEDRTSKFAAVLQGGSSKSESAPPKRSRKRIPRWLSVGGTTVLILGVGMIAAVKFGLLSPAAAEHQMLTEKVHRADLVVSIAEDGNVESQHNVDVKCEVKGGSTILWIIKDGTQVKKGDELVRLDNSLIEEQYNQQMINYEKAKALKIESEKAFRSAEIAVQEYLEGTYEQTLKDLQAKVTVAKENLESAKNALDFTLKMFRKGYVTALQRDAQAFAVTRSELDLQVAETAETVLEKFTREKTKIALESTRDSAQARMASDDAALQLEKDKLDRLQTQLEKCTIVAPDDGMVVYANDQQSFGRGGGSSQQSVIEEGAMLRERQSIIRLPDLTKMQVKCTVHESKVDALQRGMRARVHIQDRDFQGTVTFVANQAEPTNFFSGNVKEYAALVSIDSDTQGLRPGMTAAVEILVANLKNVISVPVQSVVEQGDKFYSWVSTFSGAQRRPVVLGLSNNTRIEIKDGLAEGDVLLLNPRAIVEDARKDVKEEEAVDVKKKFGDEKPAALPPQAGAPGGKAGDRGKASRGPMDLMTFDKNGDKKVSKEEAPPEAQKFFDMIDTNQDGSLDLKEINEAKRKFQEMQRAAGKGGGGPGGPGGGP